MMNIQEHVEEAKRFLENCDDINPRLANGALKATVYHLVQALDLMVEEAHNTEEDEDDYDCPQEHLNKNSCIIHTDEEDIYCPHWNICENRSETPWIYVPLR